MSNSQGSDVAIQAGDKPALYARFEQFAQAHLAGIGADARDAVWQGFAAGVLGERERLAREWDACVHEGSSGNVDIGECIREDGVKLDAGVLKT